MFHGRNRYVRSPPQGSVLPASLKVFRTAAKGRWSLNPIRCFRNLKAPNFWDNAKPSVYLAKNGGGEGGRPAWMTWDDKWVDEVRRGFKACEVFVWYPIYCKASFLLLLEEESEYLKVIVCLQGLHITS